MADSDEAAAAAAAARAAEQARLRKEKREAKILAGGAARLNKISGVAGMPRDTQPPPTTQTRLQTPPTAQPALQTPATQATLQNPPTQATPQPPAPQPPLQSAQRPYHAPDPDEVDLSHLLSSQPQFGGRGGGFDPMSAGENPFAGLQGLGGAADEGAAADPMAQMLRMMLASGGGGSGGPMPGAGPMPGKPGMPEQSAATAASAITAESLWRILHAILALTLGLFAAFQGDLRLPFLSSSYDDALVPRRGLFAGTKDERDRAAALAAVSSPELSAAAIRDAAKQFFWLFATAEALLLTTRFFLLERFGKAGASAGSHGGGILAIVADVLPEPLGGYARTLLKYWRIAGTVMADLMVCVFVLGVCVWLGR